MGICRAEPWSFAHTFIKHWLINETSMSSPAFGRVVFQLISASRCLSTLFWSFPHVNLHIHVPQPLEGQKEVSSNWSCLRCDVHTHLNPALPPHFLRKCLSETLQLKGNWRWDLVFHHLSPGLAGAEGTGTGKVKVSLVRGWVHSCAQMWEYGQHIWRTPFTS